MLSVFNFVCFSLREKYQNKLEAPLPDRWKYRALLTLKSLANPQKPEERQGSSTGKELIMKSVLIHFDAFSLFSILVSWQTYRMNCETLLMKEI